MKNITKRTSKEYIFTQGVLDSIKCICAINKERKITEMKEVSKSLGNDSILVEGLFQNYASLGSYDFYLLKTVELLVSGLLG